MGPRRTDSPHPCRGGKFSESKPGIPRSRGLCTRPRLPRPESSAAVRGPGPREVVGRRSRVSEPRARGQGPATGRLPSREGRDKGPRATDSPHPSVRRCRAGNLSEYQVQSPEGGEARFRAWSRGPSFGPLEGIRFEISVRTVRDGVSAHRSRTRGSRSQPASRSSPVERPEHRLGPGGRRTSGRMDIFDTYQQHPNHCSG